MPMKYWHGFLAAGIALAWLALTCCLGGSRTAAFRADTSKEKKVERGGKFYTGAATCNQLGCHASAPRSNEMYVCLCDEYLTWQKKDKHSQAFEVLTWERSKEMGKVLWDNPDVTRRKECLSCHAVILAKADGYDKDFTVSEGITCVVCHGAAQEKDGQIPQDNWVDYHQITRNREKLRKLTPAQKWEKHELMDLWTPSKRATLCASCHVGSIKPDEPDKFVTHDMYAAGHPPLPSFETATFSKQMPKHWRYRYEKQQHLAKNFPGKDKEAAEIIQYLPQGEERTRLALANAVVVLRESMLLLVRQAERCNAEPSGPQAIDMANFDCYACHHDLKSPSWRQERGYVGRPGRPPLRPWPTALINLAIREAAAGDAEAKELDQQFKTKLRQVQTVIEERPYGNSKKIVPAGRELAQWADHLALRLDQKKCDANDARKILREIPLFFQNVTLDYDSARQVAWTFKMIHEEVGEDDPRVQDILARQDQLLKLQLPAGKNHDLVKELKTGLEILNSYKPDQFRKSLQELSRFLDAKLPSGAGP